MSHPAELFAKLKSLNSTEKPVVQDQRAGELCALLVLRVRRRLFPRVEINYSPKTRPLLSAGDISRTFPASRFVRNASLDRTIVGNFPDARISQFRRPILSRIARIELSPSLSLLRKTAIALDRPFLCRDPARVLHFTIKRDSISKAAVHDKNTHSHSNQRCACTRRNLSRLGESHRRQKTTFSRKEQIATVHRIERQITVFHLTFCR